MPNRQFWRRVYKIAVDDLAALVVPERIILCEGSPRNLDKGFDALCYKELFSDSHPESLFISRGGAYDVEKSAELIAVLEAVAEGISVRRLIDRDEMTEAERRRKEKEGILVLGRREIESYLYDPAVLATFLTKIGEEEAVGKVVQKHKDLLSGAGANPNVKGVSRDLFEFIKTCTSHGMLGRRRKEFEKDYLLPALRETPELLEELEGDIFRNSGSEQKAERST